MTGSPTTTSSGMKYLVQWEEHPSHLATRLGYLLEHQSLVDVTLMCNTHTLKVHRSVLAACSPYFEVSKMCKLLIYSGSLFDNNGNINICV